MTAPLFPRRTVEDVAIDLIEAVATLRSARTEADRVAAALDARWAANRATWTDDLVGKIAGSGMLPAQKLL